MEIASSFSVIVVGHSILSANQSGNELPSVIWKDNDKNKITLKSLMCRLILANSRCQWAQGTEEKRVCSLHLFLILRFELRTFSISLFLEKNAPVREYEYFWHCYFRLHCLPLNLYIFSHICKNQFSPHTSLQKNIFFYVCDHIVLLKDCTSPFQVRVLANLYCLA